MGRVIGIFSGVTLAGCRRMMYWALAGLLPACCYAQTPLYKNYNVKEGLPSAITYRVLQDTTKRIWFATEAGACMYNGETFTTYTTKDGLPDNTVIDIKEDHRGRIWLICITGLPVYYHHGKIHILKIPGNKPYHEVRSLIEDNTGQIWMDAIGQRSLLKVTEQDTIIPVKTGKFSGYIAGQDRHGKIWMVSSRNVVYYNNSDFDTSTYKIAPSTDPFFTENIFNRYSFRAFNGVYDIRNGNIIVADTAAHRRLRAIHDYLAGKMVVFTDKDKYVNYWVGTYNEGLYFFPPNFIRHAGIMHYLPGKTVSCVTADHEGGMWMSTIGDGIFYLPSRAFTTFNTQNGLMDNKILSLAKQEHGHVYAGQSNGVLQEIKGDGNITTYDLDKLTGLSQGRINALYLQPDGELWIGTDNNIIIKKGKAFTTILPLKKGDRRWRYAIKCLEKGPGHTMLFSQTYSFRSIQKNDTAHNLGRQYGLSSDTRVRAIYTDDAMNSWIASQKGLYKLSGNVLSNMGEKNPLLKEDMAAIGQLQDRTLCIATRDKGLIFYNEHTGYIATLNAVQGLSGDVCRKVTVDEHDAIWVATNKGLNKITTVNGDTKKMTVKVLTADDGLASDDVNDVVVCHDTAWIATNSGLTVYVESRQDKIDAPPPVYINKAKINQRDTAVLSFYQLPYYQNNIQFNFIGLSYKSAGRVWYKYQLQGSDTAPVYTKFPAVQFAALLPGNYKLSVWAMNTDGAWSKNPASVSFSITPPFWQTWWFRTIIIIAVVGTVILFFSIRLKQVRHKEKEKGRLYKKMADMQLVALRAQMNPHFTFNSLNAIQHFIIKNDGESAQTYLAMFARLMRRVLENSKHSTIAIDDEVETLKLYLDLECMRFDDKFDYAIHVDKSIDINNDHIPSMLIQPYIENAIWHGLMHKASPGKITVSIEKENSLFKCVIEDNGIGRVKAREIRSRSGTKHQSVGMSLTQERLNILNAMYDQHHLSVEITDLADENGIACGTRVEIFMPAFND